MAVDSAGLHNLLELGGDALFEKLAPSASGDGDDGVPVADGGDTVR